MAMSSKYLFIASMDVDADKEDLFNEVYDTEHIPNILKVPGVISAGRFQLDELKLLLGGEIRTIKFDDQAKYTGVYELESPDVLTGAAFGEAVEKGRWPEQVRPYTRNRRHILMRRI
jgi:hypothetical protein